MFLTNKTKYQEVLPMGNSITQKLKYRKSVIKFSFKYGVTKAAIKFGENRRTIYRWIEKYDGTLESLKDKSRRPHHHPNEHTEEEIKMINDYKAHNKKTGLVVLWVKLKEAGYTRSVTSLYRMMVKQYQDRYFTITKLNQVKSNVMSEIKTVSDAFNVFVARLLSQTDQTQIGGFLDELKEAAVFEDRKNYSRLKKKIQEIATKADITVSDELIRELDNEVKNCGAYV